MTTFTRSEIEELEKIEIICQRKISKIKKGYETDTAGEISKVVEKYETLAEIINGINYFIGEFEHVNK